MSQRVHSIARCCIGIWLAIDTTMAPVPRVLEMIARGQTPSGRRQLDDRLIRGGTHSGSNRSRERIIHRRSVGFVDSRPEPHRRDQGVLEVLFGCRLPINRARSSAARSA